MAAVSVFVDDAVRGRLPLVCAKTGEPADVVVRMQHPVGGGMSGWALLLLLLGPIGLAALVLLAVATPGREYLTVRIPETEGSYAREKSLERFRLGALLAAPVVALCGVVYPGMFPAMWFALAASLLVAGLVLHGLVSREAIGVHLDASRRWVTLTGVHPAFVEAVEVQGARPAMAGDR